MWSLFGTEKTHPHGQYWTKEEFESSRAPQLFSFIEFTMKPFLITQINRDRRGDISWNQMFDVVCEIGKAIPRVCKYASMVYTSIRCREEKLIQAVLEDVVCQHRTKSTNSDHCTDARPSDCTQNRASENEERILQDFMKVVSAKLQRDSFENLPREVEPLWPLRPQLDDGRMAERSEEFPAQRAPLYCRMLPVIRGAEVHQLNRPRAATQALLLSRAVQFSPAELSLETLRRLSPDWRVVWTSELSEHLWVVGKDIYMYWPSTSLYSAPR
jgi:hypothetical protein